MIFSQNREDLRQFYFDTWSKYKNKLPLTPLEDQISRVIIEHPEYHSLFEQRDKYLDKDYLPEFGETNPFLHLGMHLGIREQAGTDRPQGIQTIYTQLVRKYQNDHLTAEHLMIELLAEWIWQAQRNQEAPDEKDYLEKLKQLI